MLSKNCFFKELLIRAVCLIEVVCREIETQKDMYMLDVHSQVSAKNVWLIFKYPVIPLILLHFLAIGYSK